MTSCDKCTHTKGDHRDEICYGDIGCTCMAFEETPIVLKNIPQIEKPDVIHSRTDIPLPQFITTHDNWGGKGWQYHIKWGKSQSEMVEFLFLKCKLTQQEIRIFLRCKESSVRGRLSEIRSKQNLQTIIH